MRVDDVERIPDAELRVMLVLWHTKIPLNVGEITQKLSETRPCKPGTVHVLLSRLEARGFVACDKTEYKHRFTAIISEKDYRKGEEKTLIHRFFDGSVKKMIVSLLDNDKLSDQDIDELADALERRKKNKD